MNHGRITVSLLPPKFFANQCGTKKVLPRPLLHYTDNWLSCKASTVTEVNIAQFADSITGSTNAVHLVVWYTSSSLLLNLWKLQYMHSLTFTIPFSHLLHRGPEPKQLAANKACLLIFFPAGQLCSYPPVWRYRDKCYFSSISRSIILPCAVLSMYIFGPTVALCVTFLPYLKKCNTDGECKGGGHPFFDNIFDIIYLMVYLSCVSRHASSFLLILRMPSC